MGVRWILSFAIVIVVGVFGAGSALIVPRSPAGVFGVDLVSCICLGFASRPSCELPVIAAGVFGAKLASRGSFSGFAVALCCVLLSADLLTPGRTGVCGSATL